MPCHKTSNRKSVSGQSYLLLFLVMAPATDKLYSVHLFLKGKQVDNGYSYERTFLKGGRNRGSWRKLPLTQSFDK